ncbi:MAG: hypothetical protein WBK19_02995 [Azonexus sp.]
MVSILEVDEVIGVLHHRHEIGHHRLISLPVKHSSCIFKVNFSQQLPRLRKGLAEPPANADYATRRIADSGIEGLLATRHNLTENQLGNVRIIRVEPLSQGDFSTGKVLCRKTKQGENAITDRQDCRLFTKSKLEPDGGHRDAPLWLYSNTSILSMNRPAS